MQLKQYFNKINIRKAVLLASTIVTLLLVFAGCNKKFDEPPYTSLDPDIKTNATIATVKKAFDNAGSASFAFTDSVVFSGIVISSDSSGNIYKTLYIEDSTGGINLQIDASNLYSNYPKGMRVFIKLAGLSISKNNGAYGIGQSYNASAKQMVRIPSSIMGNYIIAGSTGHVVAPVVFDKISSITDAYQSMLIQINDVQFADVNAYYADSTKTISSVGNNVTNCSGESALVYSSSYSSFAGKKVASGKGPITAIYLPYNSTKELILNDLKGTASMTAERCESSTGTISTIAALRKAYTGSDLSLSTGTVTGVVISNSTNESSGNIRVVQEDNAAGVLVFSQSSTSTYNVGDKVSISLSGSTLTSYNGELELKSATITTTGTGATVTPLTTTLAEIIKAGSAWSTRLVKVSGVTIATASTSTGGVNYSFTSGSNSVQSYVRKTSGITLTPGIATVVGYVTLYKAAAATDTTIQLTIRTASDVTSGATTGGELLYDFNGIGTDLPAGVSVHTGMSASDSGALGTFKSAATAWNSTSGGFFNYASSNGLAVTASSSDQAASTNRALAVRQISGTDKGVGFVFRLDNTTGKNSLAMSFELQSLDVSSARLMGWEISYAIGDKPMAFTTLDAANITGTMKTGNSTFGSNAISVNLGALDNKSVPVYIRIVATGSEGSNTGNRPTTGLDNVKFTWK